MAQDKVEKQQQTKSVQAKNGRGGFQQAPQQAHPELPMSVPQTQVGQARLAKVMQRRVGNGRTAHYLNQTPIQCKENKTGLPENVKTGVEALSGYSLDDVKVHYNSSKPAQVQAHAYTQGTNIHVAPGQQKHVAHEAWHVVQQKQGRVKPTMQKKGIQINDDSALEQEADQFGELASTYLLHNKEGQKATNPLTSTSDKLPIQRKLSIHGNRIDTADFNEIVFGGKPFQDTLNKLAGDSGISIVNVKAFIQSMIDQPFTHVFKGKVGEQLTALAFLLKSGGLPTNYLELTAIAINPSAQSYSLFSTVRHDREFGLATVDELGLNRKEGEADLSGFKTQVVDPNSFTNADIDAKLKEADESLITRGVHSRSVVADPSKLGASKGLGDETKKRRTVVHWDPATSNEGTHMKANPLGPDHTLGSTPGSDPKTSKKPWNIARRRMEKLTNDKVSYVAGHLLNEQLGGPGDDVRNLTPISSEANSQHKTQVENEVKRLVNKEYKWVYYDVKTERSGLDSTKKGLYDASIWEDGMFTSAFICMWGGYNAKGEPIYKKQVKLIFTDPTKLVVKTDHDTQVTAVPEQQLLPFGADVNPVRSHFDFNRVVLNTTLKVKSYLIAAQNILPKLREIQLIAQQEDTQINQLIKIITDSIVNADILDTNPQVNDEVEEYVDILNKAVGDKDEMRTIYRTDINLIMPFQLLNTRLASNILPLVESSKKNAIDDINSIQSSSKGNSAMFNASSAIKLLINQYKHPIVEAIEKILKAFVLAHDAHLQNYYIAERDYAYDLEDQLDEQEKDLDRLKSQNALLNLELSDKDRELAQKDAEISALKLKLLRKLATPPQEQDDPFSLLSRSFSHDDLGVSSSLPFSPREQPKEKQKKIAAKRDREGGQGSDIGSKTQPSIEKGKKKIRQQLVPKEAGDVVIDPTILTKAGTHIFVHSNQIELFLNQDSARQFNSDQNKGSYYFRKDGTRYKCVEFDHQYSLWKFVRS